MKRIKSFLTWGVFLTLALFLPITAQAGAPSGVTAKAGKNVTTATEGGALTVTSTSAPTYTFVAAPNLTTVTTGVWKYKYKDGGSETDAPPAGVAAVTYNSSGDVHTITVTDANFSGNALEVTASWVPTITATFASPISELKDGSNSLTTAIAYATDGTLSATLTATVTAGYKVTVAATPAPAGGTFGTVTRTNETTYSIPITAITGNVSFTLATEALPTVTVTYSGTVTGLKDAADRPLTTEVPLATDGTGGITLTATSVTSSAAGSGFVVTGLTGGGTPAPTFTLTPGTSPSLAIAGITANVSFTLGYKHLETITATYTGFTVLTDGSKFKGTDVNLTSGTAYTTDGTGAVTLTATTPGTTGFALVETTSPTVATVANTTPAAPTVTFSTLTADVAISLAYGRTVSAAIESGSSSTLDNITQGKGYALATEATYEFTVELKSPTAAGGAWTLEDGNGDPIPLKTSAGQAAPYFEVTPGADLTADPYTIKVTADASLASVATTSTEVVLFTIGYTEGSVNVGVTGVPEDVKITTGATGTVTSTSDHTIALTTTPLQNGNVKLFYLDKSGNEVAIGSSSGTNPYYENTYTIKGIGSITGGAPNPFNIIAKYVYEVTPAVASAEVGTVDPVFDIVAGTTGTFNFTPKAYSANSEPVLTFTTTPPTAAAPTYTVGDYNTTTKSYPITLSGVASAVTANVAYVPTGATFKVEAATATDPSPITAATHPIDIQTPSGTIEDGKFYVLVKPTVPGGNYNVALTTTDGADPGQTVAVTNAVVTTSDEPDENEQDTIYVSNVIYSNLTVKVQYDAPDLSITLAKRATVDGDDLITAIVPNTATTLDDGTGVFKHGTSPNIIEGFTAQLEPVAVTHSGGGKFSFVAKLADGTVLEGLKYGTPTLKQPTGSSTPNTDTYTITVEGLKYTGTTITVAYDTLPAAVVTPPAVSIVGDKLQGNEAQAVAVAKASDDGEVVAYPIADTEFKAPAEELDA
jgi:hypothetical protein